MSLILSQVNGSQIGEAKTKVDAATYYGTAFKQGVVNQAFTSLWRMSEYQAAQDEDPQLNPMIKKDEATSYLKSQGLDVKFDKDVTQNEMSLVAKRHFDERDRQAILSAGAEGNLRATGNFGMQMLGSVLSPVDLPLMFLPVVGTSTKVAGAGKAMTLLRRGIVTEEALADAGLAFKGYTAAMIEGVVGQAITEIPLFIANKQDKTEYGWSDFVTNLAMGAGFGAGVNSLRLAFRGAAHTFERLTPETKGNMAGQAADDFLRGKEIDPARQALLDSSTAEGKTLTETKKKINEADEAFKGKYKKLSPKEKQIERFNKDNKAVDAQGLPVIVYHGVLPDGAPYDAAVHGGKGKETPLFMTSNINESQFHLMAKSSTNPEVKAILNEIGDIHTEIRNNPNADHVENKAKIAELTSILEKKHGIQNIFRDGGKVDAFMVSLKNPLIVKFDPADGGPDWYDGVVGKAKNAGHDGVIIKTEGSADAYVVFDKGSLKPAYAYKHTVSLDDKQAANKKVAEDFKKYEEEKKQQKAEALKEEIKAGNTLEHPEEHQLGEHPTQEHIERLQNEIEALEEALGDLNIPNRPPLRKGESELHITGESTARLKNVVIYEFNKTRAPEEYAEYLPYELGFHAEVSKEGVRMVSRNFKGSDFLDAIKNMHPESAEIVNLLLKLDPEFANVTVRFDNDLLRLDNAAGMYRGSKHVIDLSHESSLKTVIHELQHSSTVMKFRQELANLGNYHVLSAKGEAYLVGMKDFAMKTQNKAMGNLAKSYIKAVEFHSSKAHPDAISMKEMLNSGNWSLTHAAV